ncbi:MAG: polysaccharide deacetylase family protein [Pirellulales bacterium]|nr:polysaccharide deacetylase family protein [Pirellulales bacterium]
MLFDRDIKGFDLPNKALCLTFDDGPGETAGDGPGPKTSRLAEYLWQEGIAATFFVVGRHAEQFAQTLPRLAGYGHTIGNHTYSHPGLVALALADGDVVGEIARTDAIIRPYIRADAVFLRAPYGNWRETLPPPDCGDKAESIVANILNISGQFSDYIGPVNWDISACDYDFWRVGASAEEAAAAYFQEIERIGRGIVLMHDSSDEAAIRAQERTYELTRLLVPRLKASGYRFADLDDLPQVQALRV